MRIGAGRGLLLYLLPYSRVTALTIVGQGQTTKTSFHEALPRTWDDAPWRATPAFGLTLAGCRAIASPPGSSRMA